MHDNINKRKDLVLSSPIIFYIIANVYFSFGSVFFNYPNTAEILNKYIKYGISALLILYALKYIKKRAIIYLFIAEVFFIFSYLYSFLMGYMDNSIILEYSISTLVICVPFGMLIASIENLEFLYRGLVKASYWNIGLLFIYFVFKGDTITYSMPAAYQVLFCGVMHVSELFRRSVKVKSLLIPLVILDTVLIFVKGSRGPLLILMVYVLLKILTEFWKNKKIIVWIFLGIIFMIIAVINFNQIVNFVGLILSRYNIYSRSFSLLIDNKLFGDSGRTALHDLAKTLILKSPIIGYGASSDFMLLGGAYVHSLYLELLFDFGIILGGLLFAFITINTIKSLFIRHGVKKDLLIIFTVLGYVMLMISSTYLQNIYLFLFLGLVIRQRKTKHISEYSNQVHISE
jgi:hypothetical protein